MMIGLHEHDLPWVVGLQLARRLRRRMPPRASKVALLRACDVWNRAAEACATVKTRGPDCRNTDPLPMYVEMIARAALTDQIAVTCDGMPLGLMRHTMLQIENMLSRQSYARVLIMLNRQITWSEIAPRSLASVPRGPKSLAFSRA